MGMMTLMRGQLGRAELLKNMSGRVVMTAFILLILSNLVEAVVDPDGTWWFALRAVATAVMVAGILAWLVLSVLSSIRLHRRTSL